MANSAEVQNALTVLRPLFNVKGASSEVQDALKVIQNTLAEMVEQEPQGLAAPPAATTAALWTITWDTAS